MNFLHDILQVKNAQPTFLHSRIMKTIIYQGEQYHKINTIFTLLNDSYIHKVKVLYSSIENVL